MSRGQRLEGDLPSLAVIVLIIAAILIARYFLLRWYDRRLDVREAVAREQGDELVRDYKARGATAKLDPRLDTTWRETYHDEDRWRETAPDAPPEHW